MQLSLFRRNFTLLCSSWRKNNKEENGKSREYEYNMLNPFFGGIFTVSNIFFQLGKKSEKDFFFLPSSPVQSPQSGVTKHYKSR